MKYVLVDRGDNIIDRIELTREVSLSAAKTFFVGRKRIEEKEFDNLFGNINYQSIRKFFLFFLKNILFFSQIV